MFEWDERKNTANRTKHGISFESAKLIFDDPDLVMFPERLMAATQEGGPK